MTLYNIENGDPIDAEPIMANTNANLSLTLKNHVRDLVNSTGVYSKDGTDLYGEAYIDIDGRNNSVDTLNTSAIFDTNKYIPRDTPYLLIEATSLTPSNFNINDCVCVNVSSGQYVLFCTTGTDAEKRAKIYKTLFFGTNGTDYRASTTYITGITALKTNITRDIGKQAHLINFATNASSDESTTASFNDTTNNTYCSTWSNLAISGGSGQVLYYQIPTGTEKNYAATNGPTTSYEIGTDRETDEVNNPANLKIYNDVYGASCQAYVVVISSGTLTYSSTGSPTLTTTDFNNDYSVPIFTVTDTPFINIITHNIPSGTFNSTISSAILSPIIEDWEDGASIDYKLTNSTEDTGWLTINEINEFIAFTSEPTSCIVRLTPKSTSPTAGYPSIRGVAYKAD